MVRPTVRRLIAYLRVTCTLPGVSYLPLDKNVFLRVQCMINQLENSHPEVRTLLHVHPS